MKTLRNKKYSILSLIAKYSFVLIIACALSMNAFADGEPCEGTDKSGTPIPYGCDESLPPLGIDNTNQEPAAIDLTPPKKTETSGTKVVTGITNPLSGVDSIPDFIKAVLNFVLLIGIPIVALAIIYTGFLFVTAAGNSEKLKKAKQALIYTLIGAALLLGAQVIAASIKGTVEEINRTSK